MTSSKYTTESYIEKVNTFHKNKYSYTKTIFTRLIDTITITCPIHGDFLQTAKLHTKYGCSKCAGVGKLDTDSFIEKAIKKHSTTYSYLNVKYINSHTPVVITCPIHGDFLQKPYVHLNGCGCPRCAGVDKSSTEEFIKTAIKIHGSKYDYSLCAYINNRTDLKIKCHKHGIFLQSPNVHIGKQKSGCPKCSKQNSAKLNTSTTTQFIKNAIKIHGNKYSYKKAVYNHSSEELEIICHTHGSFRQKPMVHLNGSGCPKCGLEASGKKNRNTTDNFIEHSSLVHNGKYTYENVEYSTVHEKVDITCPVHGSFSQKANDHLNNKMGCPKCGIGSSKYEEIISKFLKEKFPNLKVIARDRKVLAECGPSGGNLELDFYIPDYNLAIEVHGNYWHSEAKMEYHKARTHIFEKYRLCKERGIQLLQFYEDEMIFKEEIVKNIISHKLGLTGDRTYARKLKVIEINKTIAKEFLDDNHLQGSCGSKIVYGLVDKKEEFLYAVMAFSNLVSNRGSKAESTKWELVRFASHGSIVGGASKLLSHFINKHPECELLVSYSDNRISDGGLYDTLGFKIDSKAKIIPDYSYVTTSDKCRTRRSKSSLQKANQVKLFTAEKGYIPFVQEDSEYKNANRNGFYRIWNAGLIKWVLT